MLIGLGKESSIKIKIHESAMRGLEPPHSPARMDAPPLMGQAATNHKKGRGRTADSSMAIPQPHTLYEKIRSVGSQGTRCKT
jgi:hypothetical protein